jgi:GDP-4-dehydro-6-deoxy-D-mannose reductase
LRVLIFGVTGLLGSHLAEYFVSLGDIEVFGFKRWRSSTENLAGFDTHLRLLEGDIQDPYSVERAVRESAPERIFQLAAQSYPSESWDAPALTLSTNVLGTVHVLEAARHLTPRPRVLIACSSAEYGTISPAEVPVAESHELRPVSPYGVSKVAQELLGVQYHLSFGIPVYLARFFNQVGPRQGDRCSIQTFARQIAEIELGGNRMAVRHGNLTTQRDFLDARDGVRAVWELIEKGRPGVAYNVCSGQAVEMQAVLRQLIALADRPVSTELDASRLRPVDEPILVGDHTLLSADTGWEPRLPLSQTLGDILSYWRRRLRREGAADAPFDGSA